MLKEASQGENGKHQSAAEGDGMNTAPTFTKEIAKGKIDETRGSSQEGGRAGKGLIRQPKNRKKALFLGQPLRVNGKGGGGLENCRLLGWGVLPTRVCGKVTLMLVKES